MECRKTIIFLMFAIFIFSFTTVSASDMNDTAIDSDDTSQMGLSASNEMDADNLKTSEENTTLAYANNVKNGAAGFNSKVRGAGFRYSVLSEEISHGGNINLQHGYYTYDTGKTIDITVDNLNFINTADIVWNVTETTTKKTNIVSKTSFTTAKTNHYTKYIKVGKYKVPVWSDDNINIQKNKVITYLKKHVKKPHTFKIHRYKFKVSAKNYMKILYYKKYGYDGKFGFVPFKAKTNKYAIWKYPIYKTKKVTKYKWKYKYVKVWKFDNVWGSSKSYKLPKKYKSWKYVGDYSKTSYTGQYYYHYYIFKKKAKYHVTKDVFKGYKKVKVRVYAWSIESKFKVGVQFRGTGHGVKNVPLTSYYLF